MNNENIRVNAYDRGISFDVYVVPNAPNTEIIGMFDGALKLGIAAPPVDGKANQECIRFLAKYFNIPRSDVGILRGKRIRRKTIYIRGLLTSMFYDQIAIICK